MEDPDAPSGTFVHWVVYNLPQSTTLLPAALPTTPTLASGGNQGVNSSGKVGYMGPCPPPGAPHHYVFTVYALDSNVTLKPGVGDVHTLRAEMNGHVKGSAELVGLFSR